MNKIIRLRSSTEALELARRVSHRSIIPTLSEAGKKEFSENLAIDVNAAFSKPDVDVYGIYSGEQLIAYTAVSRNSHISQLYVSTDKQRRGLGKMLIDFVEQRAKKAGVSRLSVKASLNAVRFYEKCGFEITGDVQEVSGVRFQPMQRSVD